HPADPLSDMLGENVGHPHPAKLWKDMRTQVIGVLLPRGGLQDMVGQPSLLDISAERLPATRRVADASLPQLHLGLLHARSAAFSLVKVPAERIEPCRST